MSGTTYPLGARTGTKLLIGSTKLREDFNGVPLLTEGGKVAGFTDQDVGPVTVFQANAALRPTFMPALASMNGLDAAEFDGTTGQFFATQGGIMALESANFMIAMSTRVRTDPVAAHGSLVSFMPDEAVAGQDFYYDLERGDDAWSLNASWDAGVTGTPGKGLYVGRAPAAAGGADRHMPGVSYAFYEKAVVLLVVENGIAHVRCNTRVSPDFAWPFAFNKPGRLTFGRAVRASDLNYVIGGGKPNVFKGHLEAVYISAEPKDEGYVGNRLGSRLGLNLGLTERTVVAPGELPDPDPEPDPETDPGTGTGGTIPDPTTGNTVTVTDDGGLPTPTSGVGATAVPNYDWRAWAKPVPPATAASGILIAPRMPALATTAEVASFIIQNGSGSALSGRWDSWGEVFPPGVMKATQHLKIRRAGVEYPAQRTILSRHNDGSAFHVEIAAQLPDLAVGVSQPAKLVLIAAGPTGENKTFAGLGDKNLSVEFTVEGTVYNKAVTTLYSEALANGTLKVFRQGPFKTQIRVPAFTHKRVRGYLDLTVWFDNHITMTSHLRADLQRITTTLATNWATRMVVKRGTVTLFDSGTLTLFQGQAFRKTIYTGWSDDMNKMSQPPTHNLQRDVGRYQQIGVLPAQRLSEGMRTGTGSMVEAWNAVSARSDYMLPLAANGVYRYLPGTGDRADIGLIPAWMGAWGMTQDDRFRRWMLATAEASLAIPWNHWDAVLDKPLSIADHNRLWLDSRGQGENPAGIVFAPNGDAPSGSGWTLNFAHHPSLAFLPWITTADPMWQDQLCNEAHVGAASTWINRRTYMGGQTKAWSLVTNEESRGAAWILRGVVLAAKALQDNHPDKQFFVNLQEFNFNAWLKKAPQWQAVQGELYGWFAETSGWNQSTELKMWMQEKCMNVLAQAGKFGSQLALRVFNWATNIYVNVDTSPSTVELFRHYTWYIDPTVDTILESGKQPTVTKWSQLPSKVAADVSGNYGLLAKAVFADISILGKDATIRNKATKHYNDLTQWVPIGAVDSDAKDWWGPLTAGSQPTLTYEDVGDTETPDPDPEPDPDAEPDPVDPDPEEPTTPEPEDPATQVFLSLGGKALLIRDGGIVVNSGVTEGITLTRPSISPSTPTFRAGTPGQVIGTFNQPAASDTTKNASIVRTITVLGDRFALSSSKTQLQEGATAPTPGTRYSLTVTDTLEGAINSPQSLTFDVIAESAEVIVTPTDPDDPDADPDPVVIVPTGSFSSPLRLTGTGAPAGSVITIGHPFQRGHLSPGGALCFRRSNGTKIATAWENKSVLWDDGTVRFAVVHIADPGLTNGQVEDGYLVPEAPPSMGSTVNLASSLSGQTVQVEIKNGSNVYVMDVVASLGQSRWWQTPLSSSARVEADVPRAAVGGLTDARLIVDVTYSSDGIIDCDANLWNRNAFEANQGLATFDMRIIGAGGTKKSQSGINVYLYCQYSMRARWKKADGAAAPALPAVRHNTKYMSETGWVANYDQGLTYNASLITDLQSQMASAGWNDPRSSRGIGTSMGETGGRGDIGENTHPNALWLATGHPVAAKYAMDQSDAAGQIPWHPWNRKYGRWINPIDQPYNRASADHDSSYRRSGAEKNPWSMDAGHMPQNNFVPYLLTARRVCLDRLMGQAAWTIMEKAPAGFERGVPSATDADTDAGRQARKDSILANAAGVDFTYGVQVRSGAWTWRSLIDASIAPVSETPHGDYFRRCVEAVMNRWTRAKAALKTQQGELYGFPHGWVYGNPCNGWGASWQMDMTASQIVRGAYLGYSNHREWLPHADNWFSGRFTNNSKGFNPADGVQYNLRFSSVCPVGYNIEYTKTWAALQAATGSGTYGANFSKVTSIGNDYVMRAVAVNEQWIDVLEKFGYSSTRAKDAQTFLAGVPKAMTFTDLASYQRTPQISIIRRGKTRQP